MASCIEEDLNRIQTYISHKVCLLFGSLVEIVNSTNYRTVNSRHVTSKHNIYCLQRGLCSPLAWNPPKDSPIVYCRALLSLSIPIILLMRLARARTIILLFSYNRPTSSAPNVRRVCYAPANYTAKDPHVVRLSRSSRKTNGSSAGHREAGRTGAKKRANCLLPVL